MRLSPRINVKMYEQGNSTKSILLVSCYELGHQPAGIAMPMGFLRRAGYQTEAMDVSVEGFDAEKAKRARFVGISVPMHTALRLGLRVAEEICKAHPVLPHLLLWFVRVAQRGLSAQHRCRLGDRRRV